nr:DUF4097 family beta strand repeat protein [candidate division Zixibacteria bacterium]
MRNFLISLIVNILFLIPAAYADYSEIRNLDLEADGIGVMVIDCGAGFLKIEGAENLDRIEVKAEIVIEDMSGNKAREYIEKYANLSLENKHGRAVLVSNFENTKTSFWSLFRSQSALINLTIMVPKQMNLEIDDGSGDTWINEIKGDIYLDDGSGDLELTNINGFIELDDGSGDVHLSRLDGDIRVDDGSGDIRADNVAGTIEIDDGSGDIEVRKVDGNVVVDDGSGDIEISYVTQDVKILDDGSGQVKIAHVDGRVKR